MNPVCFVMCMQSPRYLVPQSSSGYVAGILLLVWLRFRCLESGRYTFHADNWPLTICLWWSWGNPDSHHGWQVSLSTSCLQRM